MLVAETARLAAALYDVKRCGAAPEAGLQPYDPAPIAKSATKRETAWKFKRAIPPILAPNNGSRAIDAFWLQPEETIFLKSGPVRE